MFDTIFGPLYYTEPWYFSFNNHRIIISLKLITKIKLYSKYIKCSNKKYLATVPSIPHNSYNKEKNN